VFELTPDRIDARELKAAQKLLRDFAVEIIGVNWTTVSEWMLKALSSFREVQKCRLWGDVCGRLRPIHFPAKNENVFAV